MQDRSEVRPSTARVDPGHARGDRRSSLQGVGCLLGPALLNRDPPELQELPFIPPESGHGRGVGSRSPSRLRRHVDMVQAMVVQGSLVDPILLGQGWHRPPLPEPPVHRLPRRVIAARARLAAQSRHVSPASCLASWGWRMLTLLLMFRRSFARLVRLAGRSGRGGRRSGARRGLVGAVLVLGKHGRESTTGRDHGTPPGEGFWEPLNRLRNLHIPTIPA